MSVRRVKASGKWRADWRDEFDIRRRKVFDLKANAENHERDMRKDARDNRTGTPPACDPDITLTAYAVVYQGKRPGLGIDSGTLARQEIDLRRHLLPTFGPTRVREIRREAVRNHLLAKLNAGENGQGIRPGRPVKLTRKRLARGSVRSIYHTLSAVLTEAVEDRLITSNPIRGLWRTLSKGKSAKAGAVKVKALDAEQAARLLATAKATAPEHYPYLATLILAGLRPGEGFAVVANKVNVRTKTLSVDEQIGQHGGVKSPKDGETRTVDLSAGLARILADAVRVRAKVVPIAPENAEGPWLFYPEFGPTPSRRDVQRVYKNALRGLRRVLLAADLPAHFGLHSLRHTYGAGLISRGVSPAYVQQQMGHASIQMTVDEYGSWFPAQATGAVDVLADAVLGSSSEHRGHLLDTLGVFGGSAKS
jgi:integrase